MSTKSGEDPHTANLLPDGAVLIVGGLTREGQHVVTTDVIERYVPNEKRIELVGRLRRGRAWHTTELLDDGSLLVIGGIEQNTGNGRQFLNEVEIIPAGAPPEQQTGLGKVAPLASC